MLDSVEISHLLDTWKFQDEVEFSIFFGFVDDILDFIKNLQILYDYKAQA